MNGFFGGRLNRRQYWAWVGLIVLLGAAAALALKTPVGAPVTLLWLFASAGRLHDLGRSGWWAAALVAFNAGAILAASMVGALMVGPIAYLAALLLIACTFWLGAAEGEACENRFGAPVGRPRSADV